MNTTTDVYLHGFSGEGKSLREFADAYSGSDAVCINMPGFGGEPCDESLLNGTLDEYADSVWAVIRREVPRGKVRLVCHSYGTMIGFILGCNYSADIAQLDFFCPTVHPRFSPRMVIHVTNVLRRLHFPDTLLIAILANQFLVDTVTSYMYMPDWSEATKHRIKMMRRHEATLYNATVFLLMRQTLAFKKAYEQRRCDVPTAIFYATDDTVASAHDYKWYSRHMNATKVQKMTGGHLGIVAMPHEKARFVHALAK